MSQSSRGGLIDPLTSAPRRHDHVGAVGHRFQPQVAGMVVTDDRAHSQRQLQQRHHAIGQSYDDWQSRHHQRQRQTVRGQRCGRCKLELRPIWARSASLGIDPEAGIHRHRRMTNTTGARVSAGAQVRHAACQRRLGQRAVSVCTVTIDAIGVSIARRHRHRAAIPEHRRLGLRCRRLPRCRRLRSPTCPAAQSVGSYGVAAASVAATVVNAGSIGDGTALSTGAP